METITLQFPGELDCCSISHGLHHLLLSLIAVGISLGFSPGQARLPRRIDPCWSGSLYRNGTLHFRSNGPFFPAVPPYFFLFNSLIVGSLRVKRADVRYLCGTIWRAGTATIALFLWPSTRYYK